MFLTSALFTAEASPPDRTVRLFGVDPGGGYVERMQLSSDGVLLVGRTRESQVGFLMNTDTWETEAGDGSGPVGSFVGAPLCSVTGVTTAPKADDTWQVWVACDDAGSIVGTSIASRRPVCSPVRTSPRASPRFDSATSWGSRSAG